MTVIFQGGVPHPQAGATTGGPFYGHPVFAAQVDGGAAKRRMVLAISLAPTLVPAAALAQTPQVWFSQPQATLAGNFLGHKPGKPGVFQVTQFQPNPNTADHGDVPVDWDMSGVTGLVAPPPLAAIEAGTVNRAGATGVQMAGDTIGISLNSLEFSGPGSNLSSLGVMPNYTFADLLHKPFAIPGATLVFSIDMQVPTYHVTQPASGSGYHGHGFIGMDLRFVDTTHPKSLPITLCVNAFAPHPATPERIGYTAEGKGRILMHTSLLPGNQFITVVPDTAPRQQAPWRGFKTFAVGFTAANLQAGLAAIRQELALLNSVGLQANDYSSNPADYALQEVHLNSEIDFIDPPPAIYNGGSVQMGLSERHMKVVVQ